MSKYWIRRQEGLLQDAPSIRKDWLFKIAKGMQNKIDELNKKSSPTILMISCRR